VATVLSDAQVASFREAGFLFVPEMFSKDEMQNITAWTHDLADRAEEIGKEWKYFETARTDGGRILNRIENFVPHHAQMGALVQDDRFLAACSQLFGEEAVLFKDKINCKMPGGGGFEPHQDMQAGWDIYGDLHISILVAIDPMTAQNGALDIVAGMHKQGLLGEMWAPLDEDQMKGAQWQALYCKPGDVLFFDSYAPHRSGPNTTDKARRAMYLTYGKLSDGDERARYYADKHANYPPDIERDPEGDYGYKV